MIGREFGDGRRCQRCGEPATHVTIRVWGRERWVTWWFCTDHRTAKSQPIETARPRR